MLSTSNQTADGRTATAELQAEKAAADDPALVEVERSLRLCAKFLFSRALVTHLPGGVRVDRAGYGALATLAEKGEQRLSDVAQLMQLDVSTVSRQIRLLEDAGLVARRADPEDGRAALLVLTTAGEDALRIQREARTALLADAMRDWPDADRDALRLLLGRLAEAG